MTGDRIRMQDLIPDEDHACDYCDAGSCSGFPRYTRCGGGIEEPTREWGTC